METLWTETEAAKRLKVSVALMRKWRSLSEGPEYLKLGPRLVRYSPQGIDSFIASRRVSTGSSDGG